MKRKTMFAGSFYPRFADAINRDFDKWMDEIGTVPLMKKPLGLIVPHAGYMYSGKCASYAYKALLGYKPQSIIVLHPSHRGSGFDYSLTPYSSYETPFGDILRDDELFESLKIRENTVLEKWYHENEHSLEMQLPFIKRYFDGVPIVGIMMGDPDTEVARRLALQLTDLIAKSPKRIALVVSTDLSHYRKADVAERLDATLIERVKTLDADALWKDFQSLKAESCGIGSLLSLLYMAGSFPGCKAQILNYTHSGKVSGINDKVVGYLSAQIGL